MRFEKSGVTRRGNGLGVLLLLAPTLLFVVLQQRAIAQGSPPVPEYRVKATYLFQFTQFVEWPSEAFPAEQPELVIGVLGDDPFGAFLDDTVRGEQVNGHPLVVQRYQRLADIKNCHVLFVTRSEASRIREIAAELKGRGALIVGDADGFADSGGMIQFVTQENKIRLRINLAAAKAANLTISSKLLRPATVINAGAR